MPKPGFRLATRKTKNNPDHHIWNNTGTWWGWVSLRNAESVSIRHRFSLGTPDLETARRKRDGILADLYANSGNIAA